jgi:hypothetical protein
VKDIEMDKDNLMKEINFLKKELVKCDGESL